MQRLACALVLVAGLAAADMPRGSGLPVVSAKSRSARAATRGRGVAGGVGAVAAAGRALGLAPAPWCVPPGHALDDVPAAFCERNTGLIAFADVGRSLGVVAAWRDELARNASFDRGGKRVIQGRFNASVPRAIVPEKSTLRAER